MSWWLKHRPVLAEVVLKSVHQSITFNEDDFLSTFCWEDIPYVNPSTEIRNKNLSKNVVTRQSKTIYLNTHICTHPRDFVLWLSRECRLHLLFFLLFGMDSITMFSLDLQQENSHIKIHSQQIQHKNIDAPMHIEQGIDGFGVKEIIMLDRKHPILRDH